MAVKRLIEVQSLYETLPKGTVGGKEFARIVDLLLFHKARREGKKVTLFSDAAGDYHGLDSFEGDAFRKQGTTGYQYKFYPSPLKAAHRSEIKKSLEHTAAKQKEIKLKKWILVTPQDLTQSARRKDGGDVTWFEGLREKLGLKFELEHWGHRKLQGLFIETPPLCLFYYPELVADGATRKKTIQETRGLYDDNLKTLYNQIEFVGMSVYKQEATGGVPMEEIYIPVSALPNTVDQTDPKAVRVDPLTFLERNARQVILGDPGSGKSTLLRFLALAGQSKPLQRRYKAKKDDRLPILITLRRYADELKSRKNLSLIDYIQEVIQGDFSLKSADLDFFEYYLETGQAILLFDGLDELPSPQFKKKVRDRIRTFLTTYPGNTAIVTSRIVGYGDPFRFDEKAFRHYRLTRLQLPEIEQFVHDWYRVRIENKQQREANVKDLIRILNSEEHQAIRELAMNPLLLTIIALVHRIDAVLPDERVVLYQKCTETLLISWHAWKYRDEQVTRRGRVERRNRRRMEAIAYWMHLRSGGTRKQQRSVVPYDDLKQFLTEYIEKHEKQRHPDEEPEDLAEEFLDFIKLKAGLLIEAGDEQYSFVHLTFQEYLTATHIITKSEKHGVERIWTFIKDHLDDARWHEVIRLLVADLKAYESQEYLVEALLASYEDTPGPLRAQLLGGFLMDGIEPAEADDEQILHNLFHASVLADEEEPLRATLAMLRGCSTREEVHEDSVTAAFRVLWDAPHEDRRRVALLLVAASLEWSADKFETVTRGGASLDAEDAERGGLLLGIPATVTYGPALLQNARLLWATGDYLLLSRIVGNLLARIIHNSHRWGGPGSIRLIRSRLLALKALAEAQIPDGAPKRASKTSSQVLHRANKI